MWTPSRSSALGAAGIACALILAFGSPAPAAPLSLASQTATGVASGDAGETGSAARSYFTDLPLLDQDGKEVRFYSDVLAHRIVLISGFYTHCEGLSPRQNAVLLELQKALGDYLGRDVWIVSISVDPERDTAEAVREYARTYEPRPGRLFLTGKPENVNRINQKLGQYVDDPEQHRGVYLLGNVDTEYWMKVPGHAMVADLARQIQILLDDQGETGDD